MLRLIARLLCPVATIRFAHCIAPLLVDFVMMDQRAARRLDHADAFQRVHRGLRAHVLVQDRRANRAAVSIRSSPYTISISRA